ncbi:MAG: hypothetical protein K2K45_06295 [Muribaculaceae bacterium]|nr:hypothetical protein [Muribaculaceae bacterium]
MINLPSMDMDSVRFRFYVKKSALLPGTPIKEASLGSAVYGSSETCEALGIVSPPGARP